MSLNPSETVDETTSSDTARPSDTALEDTRSEQQATSQVNSADVEEADLTIEVEEPVYKLFDSDDEDFQRRCDLLEKVVNAPTREAKRMAEKEACENFHKDKSISKKQLGRYAKRYRNKEFHLLCPGRKNKGQFRKDKQWYDFIIKTYEWGQSDGSRMNIHQVYTHLNALSLQGDKLHNSKYNKKFKGFPKVREDLIKGEHPTDPTIRKYIKHHLDRKSPKARHPGSPYSGQVVQTTDGVIELTHSNQLWQCDHTKMDVLLVDDSREVIYTTTKDGEKILGRPYITIIQDSFSGCVMGFYIGLEQPGSHEVALALRHAMLHKLYESKFSSDEKFDVNQYWKLYGTPEYFVTDRAKEFKSHHMKHVARQLDFNLGLRSFPSAGGLVETIFDKFNKELLSFLPGYTGSNVKNRPDNAEKFACLTLDELEIAVVRYLALHWNNHNYPKNQQQIDEPRRIRYDRWKAHLLIEPEKLRERELDICLLKAGHTRKVEKGGYINAWNMKYHGDCLKEYVGQKIHFRYDQRNVTRIMAYTLSTGNEPEKFIGVLKIRDLDRQQISLQEMQWMQKKLDEQGRKVSEHAILAIAHERLESHELVDKKRSERRRAKRKQAQAIRDVETNNSKVSEIFPKNAKDADNQISSEPDTGKQELKQSTLQKSVPIKPLKRPSSQPAVRSIISWEDSTEEDW